MARKKNATFQGATPFDVDVDALTLRRTIENVAGDTALLFDQLTGSNAEANTIRHIGGGRGCPLGVPLWSQYIGRSITYTGAGSVKGGVAGNVILAAHPFFWPEGETTLRVRVQASGAFADFAPRVRVTTTAGANVVGPVQLVRQQEDAATRDAYEADLDSIGTSGLYLVWCEASTSTQTADPVTLHAWVGYFNRRRAGGPVPVRRTTGTNVGVSTPATTEGVAHVNFDAATFAVDSSIDGYAATFLDRNLNGLEEFGSGWPAGGNSTYTHVDQDSGGIADPTNPARSRFHACTRSLYANEPELDFPWIAGACGAVGLDGKPVIDPVAPPVVTGMLRWFAPYPLTASSLTMARIQAYAPDFQTTTSRLKWAVLAMGEPVGAGAALANWQVTVNTGAGASAATSFGAGFAVGTSPAWFGVATGTALAFTADANNSITIASSKTTAFSSTYTEFLLLGYCFYWEP